MFTILLMQYGIKIQDFLAFTQKFSDSLLLTSGEKEICKTSYIRIITKPKSSILDLILCKNIEMIPILQRTLWKYFIIRSHLPDNILRFCFNDIISYNSNFKAKANIIRIKYISACDVFNIKREWPQLLEERNPRKTLTLSTNYKELLKTKYNRSNNLIHCVFHNDRKPSLLLNIDSCRYKCMSTSCNVQGKITNVNINKFINT